ncbi:hypothetical protein ASPZODRAFT_12070 [Penicilliopsis zonata CBS 506.65]|uniref:Uncharacterized protein n=1 Tax=Penicilliopsis zonata CBS 506.65 TaxID=1073090 RepID=A0A1L9SVH9_9EURO|nr:hypothetical protein ASPZODRAFT_12070 [Penicilliopsis zonata CBS 506.65]OJJ51232.1 hypothetical protein ASPZODRAFT_12070 [Penicilliopsis zonata CBS 506.65]
MATTVQSCYTSTAPSPAVEELVAKYSVAMSATSSSQRVSQVLLHQRRNLVQRTLDQVRLKYYQYEVTFGLYVMTPGEKFAANTFVFVVLSLLCWALLLYFPSLLYQKLSRLVWLLTGHSGEEMGAVLRSLDARPETVASAFESHRSLGL